MDPVAHQRRRLKAGWLSRRLWRRRLVFWLGAVAVGVVGVGFAVASNWAQALFAKVSGPYPWAPVLITPIGMMLCALCASRYFPGSQGSGIPHAIAARTLRTRQDRDRLLSPRIIAGKIGLTVAALLCGASVGREGPTVQIGAAIMLQVARWGRLQQERGLILAGSAAGIAAAFNTPLAGIVFAIEEMSRSFEQRTSGLVFYTVIIAGIAALALSGNYTYFGTTSATVSSVEDWALVLICGIVGGLVGGAFSRLLVEGMRRAATWIAPQPLRRVAVFALACGVVVAIAGVATGGMTYGTGYEQARAAVEGHALPWFFWPAKLVATLATAVSGVPGGIFAPSLTVGAGLGDFIAQLAGSPSSGLLVVIGMAGYFAGVVQAPLTAFVIILEMTGNHANVIPLMLASAVGFAASKILAPEPLYHALAANIVQQARADAGVSSTAG
ncbi:MAG TPA: chloride channel protein [Bauldia sp.]|nr:chloride channel protein [Bauldia sp.]